MNCSHSMTAADWIAEQRRIEQAATEGPWETGNYWGALTHGPDGVIGAYYGEECPACDESLDAEAEVVVEVGDLDWIADARTSAARCLCGSWSEVPASSGTTAACRSAPARPSLKSRRPSMPAPNTHLIAALPLVERLAQKMRLGDRDCWEWTASVTDHGYGRMSYGNHVYRVHRLAAHLWLGLDLADQSIKVCHDCDNPPCFNPDHLYLGTQKDNNRDMVQRGRAYPGPKRASHCKKGHPLTKDNTVGIKNPRCRTCNNEQQRRRRHAKRTATVAAITEALT